MTDEKIISNVELSYDGTDVKVKIDGIQLISYNPVGTVPVGTIGYTVKATTWKLQLHPDQLIYFGFSGAVSSSIFFLAKKSSGSSSEDFR